MFIASNLAFKDADIVANLDKLANKYLKTPTRDNTKLKDSPMDLIFGVDAGKAGDFWQLAASGKLSVEDLLKMDKADEAEEQRFRFVARLEEGKLDVSLQKVGPSHPFYVLEGSNNVILLTTERYNEYPMVIKGYGAGASVTAAGVFADIISIANIR